MSKTPKSTMKSVKGITSSKKVGSGDVTVNKGPGLKEPKFLLAAKYTLSQSIDDSLDAGGTFGKAGAGQIVAAYNDGYFKPKKLPNGKPYLPIHDYFKAPSEDKKDDDGKVLAQSRKTIQDNYLSLKSAKYKKLIGEFNTLTKKLSEAKSANNAFNVSEYRRQLNPVSAKVLAARSLLHRTIISLSHLYDAKVMVKSVQFGEGNQIKVDCLPNKDGSKSMHSGLFNASDLSKSGNKYLSDHQLVNSRGSNSPAPANGATTVIATPTVDVNNAKTVMAQIQKLFTNDKFNPPVEATGKKKDITVDKNDQAEMALVCIGDIKPQDMRHEELRTTISKIVVACSALLNIKNKIVSDAQTNVSMATIKKVA